MEDLGIVCAHVFRAERGVNLVAHHFDGTWQFVCGANDHPEDCADFENVGINHLIKRQPDLAALLDMERGWLAEKLSGRWIKIQHDD